MTFFDKTFLKRYPTFIAKLNELLKEDCRIEPDESMRLTNELRILALLKLGEENSQKMSRLLGVSVNTIYTYRNKMRLRAIDRDTFEESVRRLDV